MSRISTIYGFIPVDILNFKILQDGSAWTDIHRVFVTCSAKILSIRKPLAHIRKLLLPKQHIFCKKEMESVFSLVPENTARKIILIDRSKESPPHFGFSKRYNQGSIPS